MTDEPIVNTPIKIDVGQIHEKVNVAVRRASAFLRFGLEGIDGDGPADFDLSAKLHYRFWPQKIDDEARAAVRSEYAAWLVGSCLRELDLVYGLFLDEVWFAIEASEYHGKTVPAGFSFDQKFASQTNVAAKQRDVSKRLGIDEHYGEMNSLSLARNALAHNAGIVRAPRDCNNEARDWLIAKWLALDVIVSRDGHEMVFEGATIDTHEIPGKGDLGIGIKVAERSLEVSAGDKIVLSNNQLAELCMFYKILGDKTINGLLKHYRTIGGVPPSGGPV